MKLSLLSVSGMDDEDGGDRAALRRVSRAFWRCALLACAVVLAALCFAPQRAGGQDGPTAEEVVSGAMDYWRGESSISTVEMTISRPDWERRMTLRAWTLGRDDSVFKVLAPAKDRNNGTLKKQQEMWTYNPKINRTIKIPPSMMAQSWMGSDFSNNDLAKANSLLADYTHTRTGTSQHEGLTVYHVQCLPKPAAPVVWGKQTLRIREDYILLEQVFYDEDMLPVKRMTASDIAMMGGRLFPRLWVMEKVEEPGHVTRLEYTDLAFGVEIPERYFTIRWLSTPVRER